MILLSSRAQPIVIWPRGYRPPEFLDLGRECLDSSVILVFELLLNRLSRLHFPSIMPSQVTVHVSGAQWNKNRHQSKHNSRKRRPQHQGLLEGAEGTLGRPSGCLFHIEKRRSRIGEY